MSQFKSHIMSFIIILDTEEIALSGNNQHDLKAAQKTQGGDGTFQIEQHCPWGNIRHPPTTL